MSPVPGFGSMKAKKMRKVLRQLGYRALPGRGSGSHTVLRCDGRPDLIFAFHNGDTIGPSLVKKILVQQAGLSIEEARKAVSK